MNYSQPFSRTHTRPWSRLVAAIASPPASVSGKDVDRATDKAIVVLLVWTGVALFQSVPEALRSLEWAVFVAKLLDAWAWALLTPLILWTNKRVSAKYQDFVHILAVQLLLSIPFSLGHAILAGLLQYPIAQIWFNPLRSTEHYVYYFLGGWQTYCAIVGILQTLNFYNRYLTSRLELEMVEKRLLESRLNAMRLQLEPHFLFNALNAISSELESNPAQSREMIDDLGTLLRHSLECQGSNEISLANELALLDRYIAIQRLRFGDRIQIEIDVDPETLSTMVPSLLLQPIVENSIRHGIEGRLSGGSVTVSARYVGGNLQLIVQDDGVGLPRRWRFDAGAGLGLRVTRERLRALYPGLGESAFTITRRRGGGTRVVMRTPAPEARIPHVAA